MTEQAIQFQRCQNLSSATLVGIVSPASGTTGLLIVVGGPQYRVGSHRQFVKMCRAAAAAGIPAFRFDVCGMGDSTGETTTFYQQSADIHAAINQFFTLQPQLTSVVLWGLCDGASAILLALRQQPDPRVSGLVLLNPWVRQQQSYAKTMVKHYYLKRLTNKEFWQKLLSGKFNVLQSVLSLWQNLKKANQKSPGQTTELTASNEQNYVLHMQQSWSKLAAKVCVITSGEDMTAREFLDLCQQDLQWQRLLQQAEHYHLAAANHTFSTQAWRQQVEQITTTFVHQHNQDMSQG
ncbi:hydrolase 1, exosortase A system-associated [Rheinheimera sp.]|uniref:hydrolase 1, exosortase A system-associated n=1 Tax=Rheinheimera sp. TaxID=1869214 RepID=UPI002FDE11DF